VREPSLVGKDHHVTVSVACWSTGVHKHRTPYVRASRFCRVVCSTVYVCHQYSL
jgi:hypothetical protein